MVSNVSISPNTGQYKITQKSKPIKTSILYINDLHGQNIRMERMINVVNQFDRYTPSSDIDKLKFASGDIMLGEDEKHIKVGDKFLNIAGFMANVIGNHECDMPTDQFVSLIKDKKYKLLGLNMNPTSNNPIKNYIDKSYIQEINGHKYGIIGLVPPDLAKHVKLQEHLNDLNIETDFDKTIPEVQKEIDNLKKQGINKIIILSHSGYRQDIKLAKQLDGVDIILGAHTHTLIENIEKDKNLFYSKSGEPIIITQAGRDGKNFGRLDVEFNENGVITKAQNNIGYTDKYNRNAVARYEFEKVLGKPEVVGIIKYAESYPKDAYGTENPHCDFICDALKTVLNTDVGVMNSANIRGQFEKGKIDTRDLSIISPFANKVAVIEASEAELVNAIKNRVAASMKTNSHRPGIVQVSGLKYTFTKSGELKSLVFIDKNGSEFPIDINNPRKDKMYKVAADDYCICSKENGLDLEHRFQNALEKYDFDKDVIIGRYIKQLNRPIEIKSDGRIKVLDE